MKFQKFKRGIGMLLCASMMLGCLTGCGDKTDGQGDVEEEENQYPFHVEKLNGYTFTVADSNVARWFPEEGSSEIANAIINRVNMVEELFDCTIERIDYDEDQAKGALLTGTKYADIVVCQTWDLGRFLTARYLINLLDVDGLNLEADYWQRFGSTNILQYQDYIYALGAPFASQHDETFMVFYNRTMVEQIQQNRPDLKDPQELYANDEWTISNMLEWCRAAKKDLNGDGVFDGNDRYGFSAGHWEDGDRILYMGAGGKFLKEEEDGHFSLNLNTKDSFRIVNQVKDIMDPFENAYDCYQNGATVEQADIAKLFVNGQTLFYCYTRGRGWADPIYDMKDDFGIVPLPKGDNAGPDEYHCWVSHDAPSMGIFSNNKDLDKSIMIVEALAYFSQEENEIEENEFLNTKLRDDTSREIVKDLSKYAMADYVFVGQQVDGSFYSLLGALSNVTYKDRSKQIMSSVAEVEKAVETGIGVLEDVMLQVDEY